MSGGIKVICLIVLIMALGVCGRDGIRAQSPPPSTTPAPTAEALQKELSEAKSENTRLTKLLNAWQQQALGCIAQQINEKALAK